MGSPKGYYNPRFSFADFDDAEEKDREIFFINLHKISRLEKKARENLDEATIRSMEEI